MKTKAKPKGKKLVTVELSALMLSTFESVMQCDAENIGEMVAKGYYEEAIDWCRHVTVMCEVLIQAES